MSKAKFYSCNGKTMTLYEWSRQTGVEPQVIRMRIRNGWTLEKAIHTPNLRYRYDLDGALLSLNDLAELNPTLSKQAISSRLKKGNMSVHDAVFTPSMKRRNMESPCGIPCFKCPYTDCTKH